MGIEQQRDIHQKKILTSLGLRIFFISVVLLVIPLLMHSLFVYQREYVENRKEVMELLRLVGKNRTLLLEQQAKLQTQFLEILDKQAFSSPNKREDLSPLLGKLAIDGDFSSIYYFEKKGSALYLAASSDPKEIGKQVDDHDLNNAIKNPTSVHLSVSPFFCQKCLLITNTVYSTSGETLGLLVGIVPAQIFVEKLASIANAPYPIDLSIINKYDKVFVSSHPEFVGRDVFFGKGNRRATLFFQKESKLDGAFKVQFEKRSYFGVVIPVEGASYKLFLDVSQKDLFAVEKKRYFVRVLSLFIFVIVIGGGAALILILRMGRPLKHLYRVMHRIEEGDLKARYQVDRMGFEINTLGSYLNSMIVSLLEHQKEAEKERMEKTAYYQELSIGHEIQKSMLPVNLPEVEGVEIEPGFMPAKEVGGDFYDLFLSEKKEGSNLFITIADTAGKGVFACLYSLSMRSSLRSFSEVYSSLEEVTTHANNLFCQDTQESGVFVTAWLALFDPKSYILNYCCCGHYPAILIRQNAIEELGTSGMALGVLPMQGVQTKAKQLEKGDVLILYTDGVVEAQNPEGHFYGKERFLQFIQEYQHLSSEQFVTLFFKELGSFTGSAAQFDDITLLVIKF